MFSRSNIIALRSYSLIRLSHTNSALQPQLQKTEGETSPKLTDKERVQFASSSIKDIFDGFLTTEESFDPIDTKTVLADPYKFIELSQFHRDQVTEEVEKRLRRDWNKVAIESKRMAYFISYGPWGVREDLEDSCFSNVKPQDLPFETPSKIRLHNPSATDIVKKLKPVDLMQVSEKRKLEFKRITRTLDPLSKFVVYFAILISLVALYRDKYIGEDIIEEYDSPLLLAEKKRQQELDAREAEAKIKLEEEIRKQQAKKWYYLWLR